MIWSLTVPPTVRSGKTHGLDGNYNKLQCLIILGTMADVFSLSGWKEIETMMCVIFRLVHVYEIRLNCGYRLFVWLFIWDRYVFTVMFDCSITYELHWSSDIYALYGIQIFHFNKTTFFIHCFCFAGSLIKRSRQILIIISRRVGRNLYRNRLVCRNFKSRKIGNHFMKWMFRKLFVSVLIFFMKTMDVYCRYLYLVSTLLNERNGSRKI